MVLCRILNRRVVRVHLFANHMNHRHLFSALLWIQQGVFLYLHVIGCHCGSIRFKCQIPSKVVVWDCNCSDCRLRRNAHIVIPASHFNYEIIHVNTNDKSAELVEYRWGTGRARHYFCSICGISPFYIPRSNPDGMWKCCI